MAEPENNMSANMVVCKDRLTTTVPLPASLNVNSYVLDRTRHGFCCRCEMYRNFRDQVVVTQTRYMDGKAPTPPDLARTTLCLKNHRSPRLATGGFRREMSMPWFRQGTVAYSDPKFGVT